jgi:hypothetical protein
MKEIVMILGPGNTYRGKPEMEVAENYTRLASEDYDRIVVFGEGYKEISEEWDHEENLGQKGGRSLDGYVFARQPVIGIGKTNVDIISSSTIIIPYCGLKRSDGSGLYLPDMEVIQVAGSPEDMRTMKEAITKLYCRNGWVLDIFDGNIKRKPIDRISERTDIPERIDIIDPSDAREVARQRIGYDPGRLCWE